MNLSQKTIVSVAVDAGVYTSSYEFFVICLIFVFSAMNFNLILKILFCAEVQVAPLAHHSVNIFAHTHSVHTFKEL